MQIVISNLLKVVGFIFMFINLIIDLLASYYLIQTGNGGWVFLAWIFAGIPSLLLPLFTPYFFLYLISWGIGIVCLFIGFALSNEKN
jgi:hypothetical protein